MSAWKMFAIIFPIFLALDLIWLGAVAKGFYDTELGELGRRQEGALAPRWWAAALVYLLIPAGIVLFVRPLVAFDAPLLRAFGWGAMYGLVLYGVYDLTNLAVIEKWTIRMTLADIVWGSILCGTIAATMILCDRSFTL